jgi:hypothetical protein
MPHAVDLHTTLAKAAVLATKELKREALVYYIRQ